ncbi:MAG: SDR family oxidoreductase [Selenomonas noxia]|uniref:SDR family oxidoreductase n=1 Tax=Selenomonas noxia TaxID=135083 RepID=UPI0032C15658
MNYRSISFLENSLFLVTGGAGFIGSNLCEAILSMGHRVRVLDNLATGYEKNIAVFRDNPKFEFAEGDIRDFAVCDRVCRGVDYVLHHAAAVSVPESIEKPVEYTTTNIMGTVNMMEAAAKNGVKKFVYASSSAVYGDDETMPKREEMLGNRLSTYAVTKYAAEEYAYQYTLHYGLDCYGMRYFNVYGCRQDPNGAYAAVIPKFIECLLRDEPPTINGDGEQSRDFVYVEDVVQANLIACVAPHEAAGEAYNVASGKRSSLNEMYAVLSELLGKDLKPVFGPERKGDIRHSGADISKIKKKLGYAPEYDFEKGIKEAIQWYKENL